MAWLQSAIDCWQRSYDRQENGDVGGFAVRFRIRLWKGGKRDDFMCGVVFSYCFGV